MYSVESSLQKSCKRRRVDEDTRVTETSSKHARTISRRQSIGNGVNEDAQTVSSACYSQASSPCAQVHRTTSSISRQSPPESQELLPTQVVSFHHNSSVGSDIPFYSVNNRGCRALNQGFPVRNDVQQENVEYKAAPVCYGVVSNIFHVHAHRIYLCYSQICDTKVEVRWKPTDTTWESTNCVGHQLILLLNLAFREDYCLLQTIGGEDVAVLNTAAFIAFQKAMELGSVEFQAFVTEEEWKSVTFVENAVKTGLMTVDILIYGPRAVSLDVAKILVKFDHFLQYPLFDLRQCPYENPQDIDLSDFDMLTLQSAKYYSETTSVHTPNEVAGTQLSDNTIGLDELFEDLQNELYIAESSPSIEMKTMLLP